MPNILPSTSYEAARPTGLPKAEVHAEAEKFAETVGYQPGDDLEPIVTRLGGRIEIHEFAELHETGSIRVDGEGNFTIFLPPYTGRLRDRFTVAHELGHYVLHSRCGKRQIRVAREGSGPTEWEANWFAAAFLMPEKVFRQKLAEGASEGALAAFFQVSPAAVQVRRESLEG